METLNYKFTDSQKESCADAVMLSKSFLCVRYFMKMRCFPFTAPKYEALFDMILVFGESPDYLLNLYDYCIS